MEKIVPTFEEFVKESYNPFKKDSEILESIFTSSLNESKVEVKRKYAEHQHILAYSEAKFRNKVLNFVNEKGYLKEEELKQFFSKLEEEVGKQPDRSWIGKNKHYFKIIEKNDTKFYQLSKYGEKMLEKLQKAMKTGEIPEEKEEE